MNLLDRLAYDSGGYTVQEILSSFTKKIIEIIDLVNKNEEICDDAHSLIENIRNEVVPDLVEDIMKELQDTGYFDSLVNVTLINQLRTELTNSLNEAITDYTTRLDNVDSQLETIEKLKKYRYAMFTFKAVSLTDSNSKLVILLSNDGIYWEELPINYNSPNLRDPFGFLKDDYYYITATNLITDKKISYLRSKDLINFEELTYDYSGLSVYKSRWAPSIFKVKNDYYMTISLSVENSDIPRMNQYISKLDENLVPTTWSKVKINGNAKSVYDGHFIITDKQIYMYYKNTQVGYEGVEIAQSDTIDGEYEIIGNIETDNRKEAPFIFEVNGKLRLYLDTYEGEGGITYKDMVYDLDYNKNIVTNTNYKYKHCHLIDLSGKNWESNYNLSADFINLHDANSLLIKQYTNRSISPSTLNLPSVPDEEKYGKISLYKTGGKNLNQQLHLLSNKHFYRNYVNGQWSDWERVVTIKDNIPILSDIHDLTMSSYENRQTNNATLNMPSDLDSKDYWGVASLISLGSNKILILKCLNLRVYIKNYVDGVWSNWFRINAMHVD